MKTLLILLLACSTAQATLIDLTPGGFNVDTPPPEFAQFLNEWNIHEFDFFDEATPKGWISRYGILNGGTYFFTSLIGHTGQSATVSWDFGSLPGWSMTRLLIEGTSRNGTSWDNIYAIPNSLIRLDSLETILLHDGVNINSVSFFGRYPGSPIPDSGSTFIMFAIAFCTLTGLYTGIVIGKT